MLSLRGSKRGARLPCSDTLQTIFVLELLLVIPFEGKGKVPADIADLCVPHSIVHLTGSQAIKGPRHGIS